MERQTTACEMWREAFFGLDWLALRLSPVYAGIGVARGDGSPVVVVPGMLADDASLVELHGWLARVGYRPYFSAIGVNAKCPSQLLEKLLATVERAHADTGRRVAIVGHSLGGLLARAAAVKRPDLVARVITLGSPVRLTDMRPSSAVLAVAAHIFRNCSPACFEALHQPLRPECDETNIFTKSDGVVDWRSCRRDGVTCIEVQGTHVGLAVNRDVYEALGKLLATRSTARVLATARRTRLLPVETRIEPVASLEMRVAA